MNLQLNCYVVFYWKQIIHINNVILASSKQKSAIRGKSNTTNIRSMPVFIFFYQYKWLKCTINVGSLIYNKTVLLSNSKQFCILTKLRCNYWSFKIILSNDKHAFNIKNHSISSHINGNQDRNVLCKNYIFDLMRSLKWQYLRLIGSQINAFNCIGYRTIQNLILYHRERDISSKIGGTQNV